MTIFYYADQKETLAINLDAVNFISWKADQIGGPEYAVLEFGSGCKLIVRSAAAALKTFLQSRKAN